MTPESDAIAYRASVNERSSRGGFAIVIVLLVSVVALGAVITSASLTALSSRRVSSGERQATIALLAAESGLNTVLARSRTDAYAYDDTQHASVASWLTMVGLDEYELAGGATVTIVPWNQTDGVVTLQATGTATDGTTRTIFQDFILDQGELDASLFANAALITKDQLRVNSNNVVIEGKDETEADWIFTGMTLADAFEGEYVDVGGFRYRVETVVGDGTVELVAVPGGGTTTLTDSTAADLIPFAVARQMVATGSSSFVPVSNAALYTVGSVIYVGTGRGQVTGLTETSLIVDWIVAPGIVAEGTPIRMDVPSAIADPGACPASNTNNLDQKLPDGCNEQDLGDMFDNAFQGATKSEIRDMATVYDAKDWPATVSGLTWIDASKNGNISVTSANPLCGSGIVILNTGSDLEDPDGNVSITTGDCQFTGVIYIMGQLGIAGNLDQLRGAVLTEGTLASNDFTSIQGTSGSGTSKLAYDPVAVRDALQNLPPIQVDKGLIAIVENSLRLGR